MIKNIHMRDCATYSTEGASLIGCKKINFVYGANGSGKSTISNYLMCQEAPNYSKCLIDWSNDIREDILVYNRKFRETNFKATEIEGVFTIGEISIEEQNLLDDKKKELLCKRNECKKELDNRYKAETLCKKRIEEYSDEVWENVFKKYESKFSIAFKKFRKSKSKLFEEAKSKFEKRENVTATVEQLEERVKILYDEPPKQCDKFDINISNVVSELEIIENDGIWATPIVGSMDVPIGKLIHSLHSNDWVSKGRDFLEDDSDVCPFCQEHTITKNFREQIESFFDETYKLEIAKINKLREEYEGKIEELLALLDVNEVPKDKVTIGQIDLEGLNTKKELLKKTLNENLQQIKEKIKTPETKVSLNSYDDWTKGIIAIFSDADSKIDKHNVLVTNIGKSRDTLTNDIWNYVLEEQKKIFIQGNRAVKDATAAFEGIDKKATTLQLSIKELEEQIEDISQNLTSVQPTVDAINKMLKGYGFTNFLIAPSDNKPNSYQIQREDGTLATNTLSEGEETFISFLYFMQLQKGAIDLSKVHSKRIIVLDDPICSLDSNILYIVSAMVKELIRSVKDDKSEVSQVFILTHNVFFHKEASFIDGRGNEYKDVNYWIISKEKNVSTIKHYGMENPIKTSYDLLWREIRDWNGAFSVTIQNAMRRIIENYFNMLGKRKEAFIESKFDTPQDAMVCKSLFHWVNDGSHSITDDIYIDPYTDSTERFRDVFHQIFIKTGNEAHYNMMMGNEQYDET